MSNEIQAYNWWGNGENEPPARLKTKRQLLGMGLRPVKPVGVIHCREYDCLLYDPDNSDSAKPKRKASSKQLEVLARNREKQQRSAAFKEWYGAVGFIESDRVDAVLWARELLERDDWVVLDTETTGLEYDAQIVEIAVVDRFGEPLLDTLVKPTIGIPNEATEIHGITDEMVATAPTFPEVFASIRSVLEGKHVLIYNSSFDIGILGYCRRLHKLEPPLGLNKRSDCIMEWFSQWCGDWSSYWKDYRWQPLNGGHRAKEDCALAIKRLYRMAEDSPEIVYPKGVYPPPDYGLKNH